MPEQRSTYRTLMPFASAFLFALCFARSGSLAIPAIFTGILILCICKARVIRFTLADILIIVLLVWEFALGIFTQGRNNCIEYLTTQYIFTAYYFILRHTLTDYLATKRFLQSMSVFIIGIAVISIVSFCIFEKQVHDAGFESLYDFKHLYRPLGNLNNVWGTLMLVLAGITAIPLLTYGRKGGNFIYGIIPFALTVVCLMLSFSRGIYICMGLFVLLIWSYIILSESKIWVKVLECMAMVVFVISIASIHRTDSLRTARLVETASQQRSLEGRLDAVEYTLNVLRENPLMGVGTGNYSLAVNRHLYENNNDSYTNLAPNIISQLLLEKGMVGTVLWPLVFIVLIVQLFVNRHRDRKMQVFIVFFLSIVLVREMSMAAALTDRRILAALAVLLALFQNNIDDGRMRKRLLGGISKQACIITAAIFFCGLCLFHYVFHKDFGCYMNYSVAMNSVDSHSAYRSLEKARNNVATNVLASSASLKMYFETGDRSYLLYAKEHIDKAVSLSPGDARLSAFRSVVLLYLHGKTTALAALDSLVSEFPANTDYRLLTAKIHYLSGDKAAALPHLTQAVISSPSILEGCVWQEFADGDPESAETVEAAIENIVRRKPDDPMLLSRYGKLLYLVGDSETAREYLWTAAALLPNLKTPWVYLAKIEGTGKHPALLQHLKLWGYSGKRPDDKDMESDYSSYDMKSIQWYCYPLYGTTNFKIDCNWKNI